MKTRLLLLALWLVGAALPQLQAAGAKELPNVVIIFTDDQGYADVGVFGAKGFETPNLDRMAREGRKFSQFYVAQAVCSASRTALLTGCYPNRVGIVGALGPQAKHGISNNEMTLAQLVKQKNYATAIFGKWHLGHHKQFLPLQHGFDQYFGLPYSNDMWPFHPDKSQRTNYPPLPLFEGNEVIATNPDQTQLTTWYTDRAVRFISQNKSRPFFLYVAHNMPHVPLHVSDKFKGKSNAGLYGDVIMEIDWSVGQILKALKENGLDEKALVIFASDNGPWLSYGNHAGSAGFLREGKGTSWEGGVRVPCIMRWPGKIPAESECSTPIMTIDILPTIAALTGAKLPDHKIDGLNVWPIISGAPNARNPHEAYFIYYNQNDLQAAISDHWKLIAPHTYRTLAGRPGGKDGLPSPYEQRQAALELYNLKTDPGETKNVAQENPNVVQRIQKLMAGCREDLGDGLLKKKGANRREPGKI